MPDTLYEAAIDTAGAAASFAVRPLPPSAGETHRLHSPLGRASSGLMPAIQDCCATAGVPLHTIVRWTVGMGPGSFTGIRVGSAMAMGLIAGRPDARLRGLPSGIALTRAIDAPAGSRVAALNDGRRHQAIVSPYRVTADGILPDGESEPMGVDALPDLAVDYFAIRADDPLAESLGESLGDRLRVVDALDAALLLDPPGHPWTEDPAEDAASVDPVYVRPAVFVPPAPKPAVPR